MGLRLMGNAVITFVETALAEVLGPEIPEGRRPDGSPWGSVYWRDLDNGREITIFPLTFGAGRLGVGNLGEPCTDLFYDYPHFEMAVIAAVHWDGVSDPGSNWERCSAGRRRPGGLESQEYIPED